MSSHKFIFSLAFIGLCGLVSAQSNEKTNSKTGDYHFTPVIELGSTPVKNQYKSSTCWSFSAESMLESEVLRLGKGPIDLSEMWIVRNAYYEKAVKYVRMGGTINFGPGGAFHDVVNMVKKYGVMPQSAYPGMPKDAIKPEQNEVDAVLKAYLDAVIKMPNGRLSGQWLDGLNGILDAYYGKMPLTFSAEGKTFTPVQYAEFLGIKPEAYVELTSFTHHPFYQPFILEVPDNWAWNALENVTLDEMQAVLDNALKNGFSVAWAADVSEKGFSHKNGIAIVPQKPWEDMRSGEKDSVYIHPVPERTITQEYRQEAFDNQSTTDDHGMHIVGTATDQNGTLYYKVKNSWGTENNDLGGYFYCSASYFRYKTTGIMVHRDAIPKDIRKKLGL